MSWVVARSWQARINHTIVNQAVLISTGAVALAEIGDKTQLLSLVLAARYRKPVPIILGVLSATLVSVDGESNWLEGAQLLAVYLIVALGFYYTGTVAPHS